MPEKVLTSVSCFISDAVSYLSWRVLLVIFGVLLSSCVPLFDLPCLDLRRRLHESKIPFLAERGLVLPPGGRCAHMKVKFRKKIRSVLCGLAWRAL